MTTKLVDDLIALLPCPFCGGEADYGGCQPSTGFVRCVSGVKPHCPASFGCVSPETWNRRAATPSTAQESTGTMRLGADKLERTRPNAEYWLSHGRKESDRDKAVMYVEQSSNAWKNAAYGLAEKLAKTEATAQAALPDGPPLHVAETLIYQIEHGTAFDTSVLLSVLRAHCLALRG